MIKLKTILSELAESDIQRLLKRIKNKEFRFLAQGDNGRVYEIDNEDKVFKVTQESSEFEVATVIVGRHTQFTTFIPVYYVNEIENGILPASSYIMAKANKLNRNMQNNIIQFTDGFKRYAQEMGGEITIFDYLDNVILLTVDLVILQQHLWYYIIQTQYEMYIWAYLSMHILKILYHCVHSMILMQM